MRELEFRALDEENLKYVYDGDKWSPKNRNSYYPVTITSFGILYEKYISDNDSVVVNIDGNSMTFYSEWENMEVHKRGFILEQYTGLKDKNGKKIFEGDIVKSKIHNPENYQIEFIEGGFCATNKKCFPIDINHFYPSPGVEIEIVGNIHENKELLCK